MGTKNIKKNYLLNLIYQITLIIVPLIVTPYISRVLLADGVGKYSFSFSLITYFTLLASFGFENYAQREIAKTQGNKEAQSVMFWEIIISKMIPILCSLAIHLILILSNVYGNYSTLMQILSINIIAIAFDVSFFLQGNEEFGKLVARNLIIKFTGTLLIFVFVKTQNDLWKYTLIQSLMVIISNVSLIPSLCKKLTKINPKKLKITKHLIGSFKLFIPTIAVSLYTVLDRSLIGIITHSNAQNGYYEQAEKIVKLCMTIITCMSSVMIPRNSNEISVGNHQQVKQNVYKCFNFIWLIGIPLSVGLVLVANNVIPWFLGSDFTPVSNLIQVFSLLIIIIGCSNILGLQYLVPYKKDKYYTISILVGSGINLIFNIILIYNLQALGAVIATIVSELAVTICMFIFVRKELSLKNIFKTIIKPLIAATIMFCLVYPLTIILSANFINTCLIILSGGCIYGICILLLREEMTLKFIKKIFKKSHKIETPKKDD